MTLAFAPTAKDLDEFLFAVPVLACPPGKRLPIQPEAATPAHHTPRINPPSTRRFWPVI